MELSEETLSSLEAYAGDAVYESETSSSSCADDACRRGCDFNCDGNCWSESALGF